MTDEGEFPEHTLEEELLWRASAAEQPGAASQQALFAALGLEGGPPGPDGGQAQAGPAGKAATPLASSKLFVGGGAVVALGLALWFASSSASELSPRTDLVKAPSASSPADTAASPQPEAQAPKAASHSASPGQAGIVDEAVQAPEASVLEPTAARPRKSPDAAMPSSWTSHGASPSRTADEPEPPSLSEELARISRAKSEVSQGDLGAAWKTLDQYERDFSKPRLLSEATLLRVRILLRTGKRAEAERRAQVLLAPGSAYRERVQTLLQSH